MPDATRMNQALTPSIMHTPEEVVARPCYFARPDPNPPHLRPQPCGALVLVPVAPYQ
jgi:hypothetical protein